MRTGDGRTWRGSIPASFSSAKWSLKQWNVLDGLKVNGAGSGHFEYRLPWPPGLKLADVAAAAFLVEASAKQLYGKDRDDAAARCRATTCGAWARTTRAAIPTRIR